MRGRSGQTNPKRPQLRCPSSFFPCASCLSCPFRTSRHNSHSNLLPQGGSSRRLSFSCHTSHRYSSNNLLLRHGSSDHLSASCHTNRRNNNSRASRTALSHLSSKPHRDRNTPSRNTSQWLSFDLFA